VTGSELTHQFRPLCGRYASACSDYYAYRGRYSPASLSAGAAAHSFRHHYGVTLVLRGVPQAAISQLMGHADPRTTAIYTTVASSALIGVLDDAGLL